MARSSFVYVIYIDSGPETVWNALLDGRFTRQYWGHENVSDWKPGSPWEHRDANDGTLRLVGNVVGFDPPRRLVMTWAFPAGQTDAAAPSQVSLEVEPLDGMVRLRVIHEGLVRGSEMHRGIEAGWPRVLASLKSYLETGRPLPTWAGDGR